MSVFLSAAQGKEFYPQSLSKMQENMKHRESKRTEKERIREGEE